MDKVIEKIQKYLIYILFSLPFIFFLVNQTRNPFYVQEVIIVIISTLIFITFIFEKNLTFNKIILTEKLLFIFWIITILSWLIAFIKFPNWTLPVFNEGSKSFVLLIFNTIFIYLLRKKINNHQIIDKLWQIIFFTSFLASIYGLFQFFGIELIWPIRLNPFGNRCVSTFGNPNFLASYLIMLIPLGIYFII